MHGNHVYKISNEIRIKHEVFKSSSSPATKSIDHFVKMRDEAGGAIELFVMNNENRYILLQKFEIIHEKYHFQEVKLISPKVISL